MKNDHSKVLLELISIYKLDTIPNLIQNIIIRINAIPYDEDTEEIDFLLDVRNKIDEMLDAQKN